MAIYTLPNGGAGGSGYDGTGQVVLKGANAFTSVTTAVNVSGGSILVLLTNPTLNGAKFTKTNGGMIYGSLVTFYKFLNTIKY